MTEVVHVPKNSHKNIRRQKFEFEKLLSCLHIFMTSMCHEYTFHLRVPSSCSTGPSASFFGNILWVSGTWILCNILLVLCDHLLSCRFILLVIRDNPLVPWDCPLVLVDSSGCGSMSVLDAQSYTMVQDTMCIHTQRLPRQASRHFTDMLVMSQLRELNSAPPTLSRTAELSDVKRIAVCGCAAPTEASLFTGLLQNRGLFKFKAS